MDTSFAQSFATEGFADLLSGTAGSAPNGLAAERVVRIAAQARIGINAVTGLATDFLNQFNEASMLLDMVGDDPSLVEDLEGWRARDYVSHFTRSGFADRHLVLEAYELAPPLTRRRFDALCDDLSAVLAQGLAFLVNCRAAGAHAVLSPAAAALGREVRLRLDELDALIHAGLRRPLQASVDSMFRPRA